MAQCRWSRAQRKYHARHVSEEARLSSTHIRGFNCYHIAMQVPLTIGTAIDSVHVATSSFCP